MTMRPTDVLRNEHVAIQTALRILSVICGKLRANEIVNAGEVDSLLEFITEFADRCHHGKEEALLFPAMERLRIKRGQPKMRLS